MKTPHAAASYIVQPPSLTLGGIRAELLPLAHACGYVDVTVSASTSQYGPAFWAVAHRPDGCSQSLAVSVINDTPEALRDTALEALYTEAGTSGASL